MLASLLGVRMTLYLGPTLAVPAPLSIVEALSAVEVSLNSKGRDGFSLTFTLGRGPGDILDYPLLANPLLRPFSRVVIQVWMGVTPEVLIDGFILKHTVSPGSTPGTSTLSITGEDIRVKMDVADEDLPHPQLTPDARVRVILAKHMLLLGMPPIVIPPPVPDLPLVMERIPAQIETDLRYVERLAWECGYVFYVEPGPAPNVNTAYWGPENRQSISQSALSVDMGPETNVISLNFNYDALRPTMVIGAIQDKRSPLVFPIITFASTKPPLAALPALLVQQPNVRKQRAKESGGLDPVQALARAQAVTDESSDAVDAQGELDALRYNGLLRARRRVDVRGAGFLLDGEYYVKQVSHSIKRGEYKQQFSLSRGGFGALSPFVVVR